jgi:hypothetical protein
MFTYLTQLVMRIVTLMSAAVRKVADFVMEIVQRATDWRLLTRAQVRLIRFINSVNATVHSSITVAIVFTRLRYRENETMLRIR